MKKILAIILTLTLVIGAMVTLVACTDPNAGGDKTKPTTVMSISLNPEIEFVLDGNDKVLSVNALNEEGNLIITATATGFVGLTAEEAAELFVSLSKEMGFVVEGSLGADEKISIQITGDTTAATELYNSVKDKINEFFSEENISATVEQVTATAEEALESLRAQVEKIAPYIEEAKLEAMTQAELMQELYASHKETAKLYSQELKNAYYQAKELAMENAKFEEIKTKLGQQFTTALQTAHDTYVEKMEEIEEYRNTYLVSEESDYQKALAQLRTAKEDFLKYRQEIAESGQEPSAVQSALLTAKENAITLAETTLNSAGTIAHTSIDGMKAIAEGLYNSTMEIITQIGFALNDHVTAIETAQQEAVATFTTAFETTYAQAITAAENNWNAMKETLAPTTSPEGETTPAE